MHSKGKHQSTPAQPTARENFFWIPRELSQMQKKLQKPDFWILIVVSKSLPNYNEIDITARGTFMFIILWLGPSCFLSCACLP